MYHVLQDLLPPSPPGGGAQLHLRLPGGGEEEDRRPEPRGKGGEGQENLRTSTVIVISN